MSQHAQYDPYASQRYATPPPPQRDQHAPAPAPRKRRRWPWVVGIVLAFLVGVGVGGSPDSRPSTATPSASAPAAGAAVAQEPAAEQASSGPLTTTGDCSGCEVGVDLEPGRYKTAGPDGSGPLSMCYWKRASNDSGELAAIIANENIKGPGAVTLKKGEFVEFSGGCTWAKV